MAAIDGRADFYVQDALIRRYLTYLTRMETALAEAVAGLAFTTYSQIRAAFVTARLQLDDVIDDVYEAGLVVDATSYGWSPDLPRDVRMTPRFAIETSGGAPWES